MSITRTITLASSIASIAAFTATTASAIEFNQTYTDPNGQFEVHIHGCEASGLGLQHQGTCDVPQEYVLIGGGAEVVPEANSPGPQPHFGNRGAVLTRSSPNSGCGLWVGESRGDRTNFSHKLQVYAIGLRLHSKSNPAAYISAATLSQNRECNSTTGFGLVNSPSPPAGNVLVGGGAAVVPSGPGLYLSDSYPNGTGTPNSSTRWVGRSNYLEDQVDGGSTRVFEISLKATIVDFGPIVNHFSGGTVSCSTFSSLSGRQDLLDPSVQPGVATTTGGQALHSDETGGRFLFQLSPIGSTGGFPWPGETIGTTDYLFGDGPPTDSGCGARNRYMWISH